MDTPSEFLTKFGVVIGPRGHAARVQYAGGAGGEGYLSGVLTAIAGGHKQTDIKDLLPWNYVRPV